MNKSEQMGIPRVRGRGHHNKGTLAGAAIVEAMRDAVERRSYTTINGVTVDTYSASAVIAVFDNLNAANREKLLARSVTGMVDVAFRILNRVQGN